MTETSKAPTDAEILTRTDEHIAATARRMAALAQLDHAMRGGRSLSQLKRSTVASIAVAFGMTVTSSTLKAAMVNHIVETEKTWR